MALKSRRVYLLLFFGIVFLSYTALAGNAADKAGKKVLVVHSYHETQKGHVVEMTEGINEAFSGANVKMEFFHMDTKRNPTPDFKRKSGLAASQIMHTFNPDVVIAMDDNAQKYFVVNEMDKTDAPIFVFGGVNAELGAYGYPRPNVTGVLERPNIGESIELLKKISPGVKKILMISDKSRTTDLFVSYAQTLDLSTEVEGYVQVRTVAEWEKTIDTYADKVDAFGVYLLRTVKIDEASPSMAKESDLVAMLNQKGGLPTVGFYDTAAQSGVLCGISVSMKEQGYMAANMARTILEQKKKPSDFPIEPTKRGRIQLNLQTAKQLGIEIDWNIISKADVVVK